MKKLLDSLARQTWPGFFETIVVDDASFDDTEAVARAFPVRYLRQERRAGPAAARNRGVGAAQGEWLVFADADTVFFPDTMAWVARAVAECPQAHAFFGSYAGAPANPGFMPRFKGLWEQVVIDDALMRRGGGVAYVPCGVWAPRPGIVRRDAFEAVAGFDEHFGGADLEDIDLGYRLHARGYRIFFAPHIRIQHHYPATFLREIRPFARRCALWITMNTHRRGFDAAGEGSLRQAAAHGMGFSLFFLMPLLIVGSRVALIPLVAAAGYVLLYRRFLRTAYAAEGAWFAIRALAVCWMHSVVLGFAAGWGLLRHVCARRRCGPHPDPSQEGRDRKE